MTQRMDLGGCLFGTKESPLQLQLGAIAHFCHPSSQPGPIHSSQLTEWLDSSLVWIKAVPELKLCLSVSAGIGLDIAVSDFVSDLEKSLCSSSAWSAFGFAISHPNSDGSAQNGHPEPNSINFGICRNNRTSYLAIGRGLPILLHNPPDAQPPPDVPTVSLAEIELSLQFSIKPGKRRHKLLLPLDLPGDLNPTSAGPATCPYLVDIGVDSGLQRLTVHAPTKDFGIQVVGEDTLKTLSDQAPVIFNRQYREAMNQRAVSIPIIVKAIGSMLQNTENPLLRENTSALLRLSQNHVEGNYSIQEHASSLQSTITSSLWRIAQSKLRRVKVSKSTVTFCPINAQHTNNQPASGAGDNIMNFFEQSDVSDSEMLDMDDFVDEYIDNRYMDFENILRSSDEFDVKSEGPLLDSSQSNFSDIYESTQTTLDDNNEPAASNHDWEICFDSDSDSELIEA
ncbi:hypothetical protein N7495_000524 [Penicillium taxi]|uniref:uncharacterized protein n=1 Tax=Penicillium taxi TaxID=168475 RepID=UPI002544F7B2|nr:uncharacterized protein N7495_000524 [Penicillium taxi]KAJ5907842.1 hypothetical protein N7495_000524 [Penicillium taxi]